MGLDGRQRGLERVVIFLNPRIVFIFDCVRDVALGLQPNSERLLREPDLRERARRRRKRIRLLEILQREIVFALLTKRDAAFDQRVRILIIGLRVRDGAEAGDRNQSEARPKAHGREPSAKWARRSVTNMSWRQRWRSARFFRCLMEARSNARGQSRLRYAASRMAEPKVGALPMPSPLRSSAADRSSRSPTPPRSTCSVRHSLQHSSDARRSPK
jgi:hypothetical protein